MPRRVIEKSLLERIIKKRKAYISFEIFYKIMHSDEPEEEKFRQINSVLEGLGLYKNNAEAKRAYEALELFIEKYIKKDLKDK